MGRQFILKILLCAALLISATLPSGCANADGDSPPASLTCFSPEEPKDGKYDVDHISKTIKQNIKKLHREFQGVVLVAQGPTVLFNAGYGNFNHIIQYSHETPILLTSVTKQFTES